ncbi:MAG TPA: Uma2 family endonuclease [Terracidiphilus sp.]|nr:Uma2 family endonuclease [Terracidiphilus sp.]
MSTATHISEDEYLRSAFEPDAEYVDGEVRERNVGTYDHSDWQQAILTWFLQHAKDWNVRSVPEQRMRVRLGSYRIPDVSVLDRANPKEQVVTAPPIAVFEVLSPEDRVQALNEKLDDYAKMGIPHIWIIDPKTGIFKRYTNGSLLVLERFDFTERGIAFDLTEIKTLLQD